LATLSLNWLTCSDKLFNRKYRGHFERHRESRYGARRLRLS
jgi:hypothetical protein